MTDNNSSTQSLSLGKTASLLIAYVISCLVLLLALDTLYRLDSLVMAMPIYDVVVAVSAMFIVFLIIGLGIVFAGLGVTLLTWPFRNRLLAVIRLFALVFLTLIISRTTCHWLLKVTGIETWTLSQWATSVFGLHLSASAVLRVFYILIITALAIFLIKAKRLKYIQKEFDVVGKAFAKTVLMIAVIPVVIISYHLLSVSGKKERAICTNDSILSHSGPALAKNRDSLPDILLVTFDALTARDMSLYGYRLLTTPGIQKLAQESYVYEHAVSTSNWTKPTTVSMLTGQYPHRHGLFSTQSDAITLRQPERTLPNLLRSKGYRTMAVVSNPGYAHPFTNGTYRSFDTCTWDAFSSDFVDGDAFLRLRHYVRSEVAAILLDYDIYISGWLDSLLNFFSAFQIFGENTSLNKSTIASAEQTFAYAQQVIEKGARQPTFIWIHVFPPHGPYFPNAKYQKRFLASDGFNTVESQARVPAGNYPKNLQANVDQLRLRYDEFILNSDQAFANFIGFLKKSGHWENTLLVVSADHGESFEDNLRGHRGEFLYQQLIHIPLLFHLPGQRQGIRVDSVASQVDIGPTILHYLKAPTPSWMDGQPLGLGKEERKGYRYSMEIEANGNRPKISKGIVAITDGRYKFIYSLSHNSIELFDLKTDPEESKNIASENSSLVERMRTTLVSELERK